MGWLTPKIPSNPTPSSTAPAGGAGTPQPQPAPSPSPGGWRERAFQEKRATVHKVGTIERLPNGEYEARGWEIDGIDTDGPTHYGRLGTLTVADLQRIARENS